MYLAQNNKARRESPSYIAVVGRRALEGGVLEARQHIVAVIDDDDGLRDALANLLRSRGYGVEQYASAVAFLAAAPTTASSCLLIDIELGAVSSFELAQQLVASGFSFPIVFMSGSHDEGYQRVASAMGCIAFLQKPFRSSELMTAISKALDLAARP